MIPVPRAPRLRRPRGPSAARVGSALSVALGLHAAAFLTACAEEESAMLVTVRVRPAVVGATSLAVELKNGAGLAGDSFELRDHPFPVTFTVSSPGRTGDLEVKVSAKNADGVLVGRGAATIPILAETGEVLVDSADFVVNSDFVDDQFLTNDFEASGNQLSANPGTGEWTASFRQRCTTTGCNVYARRFDRNGQPLTSGVAGSNAFPVNTARAGVISSSAAAGNADKTILLWESVTAGTETADGVACRAYDRAGTASATTEKRIATDLGTDVVSATALPNGTFAASWAGRTVAGDPLNIRTLVVDSNCNALSTLTPVGTLLPTGGLRQSSIAASGADSYLIAWKSENTVRARSVALNGTPATPDTLLLTPPAGEDFAMVRLAANNNGYVLIVARKAGTKTSLEMYRVTASATAAPALVGSATVITDKIDGIFEGFAVASHPLGPVLVTWHGCGTERGDGEGCGVFARVIATNGTPIGEPFLVATTTALDQSNTSVVPITAADGGPLFVVAWNDASTAAPDIGGLAVRARIIYPQLP